MSNNTHNNGGNLYLIDKLLFKVFKQFYAYKEEIERNIDFQINNPIICTPKIFEKIYIDGEFKGYAMEYIPEAITFRSAIGRGIDISLKIEAIKNIYSALRVLHANNIFLGDIHSDNFLITQDGKGYLIDLDYMRFPGDEYKFEQCYLIKPNTLSYKINVASKYTDNIKVMLSSLSLLLDVDLEKYINIDTKDINLESIYKDIVVPCNDKILDDYFKKIIKGEDVDYFYDYCLVRKRESDFSQTKIK